MVTSTDCPLVRAFPPVLQYTPSSIGPDEVPCSACPLNLSTAPARKRVPCTRCGFERVSLFDLKSEELKVPDVSVDDFRKVMERATTSVAERELKPFLDFTAEFGSDGS